jgi:hypothetical protein
MKFLHYIFFLINIRKVELYFIQNKNKPICANCKFFIANKNECSNFGDVNIITGKYNYEKATSVRNDEDKCGEYGILFKQNYFKFITVPYYFVLEDGKDLFLIFTCFLPFVFLVFILLHL